MILSLALYLSVSAHVSAGPIGFLTLWPRGNVVVFSDLLIKVDGVAIDSIEAYSDSQIIVSDVDGERWMWDLKELKVASRLRQASKQTTFKIVDCDYQPTAMSKEVSSIIPNGWKRGYNPKTDQKTNIGIGVGQLSDSWFKAGYVSNSSRCSVSRTEVSMIQGGRPRTYLTTNGEICPIAVWSRTSYLATYPVNDIFGELIFMKGGKRTVLLSHTGSFLPLRLNR